MPARAPTPCRSAGCPRLCRDGSGRCDQHAGDGWKAHQKGRSAAGRGYGAAWRRLRSAVIIRDGGRCQDCKAQGKARIGTEVDHIVSKAQGGSDELENLRLLCRKCHLSKTGRDAHAQSQAR